MFGSKQLNELVTPIQKHENLNRHVNRHKVDLELVGTSSRVEGYHAFEAGV